MSEDNLNKDGAVSVPAFQRRGLYVARASRSYGGGAVLSRSIFGLTFDRSDT